jgi:hypothetical protein
MGLGDGHEGTSPASVDRTRLWRVVTMWVPVDYVDRSGVDTAAFVEWLNDRIVERGLVLYDGQLLASVLDPDEPIDVTFEPDSLGHEMPIPRRRNWGQPQYAYFGLHNPHQMGDAGERYSWSHIQTRVFEPYLHVQEFIAGLVHGVTDGHYFTCPCHSSTVVYTSERRLICMSCGATHLVFNDPLDLPSKSGLNETDWLELFEDEHGPRADEDVDLAILDFARVENEPVIWSTDQWSEASHQFRFFARSSREEIEQAIRGTEADTAVLREAGFRAEPMPTPPAQQLLPNGVELTLLDGAAEALAEAADDFADASRNPARLVQALPNLHRATELALKARLADHEPEVIVQRLNSRSVIERLAKHGSTLEAGELDTLSELRRARNRIEHGETSFGHRTGLALFRRGVEFIDRFAADQLDLWIGDVVQGRGWQRLLAIESIGNRADAVATRRSDAIRAGGQATVETCQRCGRETMLRPHPSTGASCVRCGYVHVFA